MLTDDSEQNTSVFGVDLTQGLDDTWITAEAKYCTNFTESGKRFFFLSFHNNRSNSILFANATKIYKFKSRGSNIKPYEIFENISHLITWLNGKKTGLNVYVYDFLLIIIPSIPSTSSIFINIWWKTMI